ncbi:DUF2188 domain-containing protein [Deinococcus cellulosilyticus]|uniref:DUF2188 domain-containing protein n=1 Tax=Deinococcus cellulosilyticus (strain DSM 18568 / NBRC 106333 / KACC 11606 / 5516J-15) TaxID=1223518 RepID=A0A511MVT5_DEIC1|nr:DUF2188 domain-containing protein [Deinococcus cellulosilyticus]GEM44695.1 hypothetical protein DC3_03300 [Deinococcus cellulosilyticus NBRC 106333 = KACC 11606]
MPWNSENYPQSLKNFNPEVRSKAVEIANALLEEGHDEGSAIAIATDRAEEWAKNRDIPIRQDES